MAPEYTIMSRVKKGTAPYELTFLDALPTAQEEIKRWLLKQKI